MPYASGETLPGGAFHRAGQKVFPYNVKRAARVKTYSPYQGVLLTCQRVLLYTQPQ